MSTVAPENRMTSESRAAPGRVQLRRLLFGNPDESPYAVLDGARLPGLVERLRAAGDEHACLYRGELKPDLAAAAPYLVKLAADSPLLGWLGEEQWGNSAGIFAVSRVALAPLRHHFRGFLRVRGPAGNVLYFRWYDPRVLRVYLPTCNAGELTTVFGPVSRFVCEGGNASEALVFEQDRGRPTCRVVAG